MKLAHNHSLESRCLSPFRATRAEKQWTGTVEFYNAEHDVMQDIQYLVYQDDVGLEWENGL